MVWNGGPVNGEMMMAEMASQPEVLTRLVARAPSDAAKVRAVVPDPLAGVVFLARGSSDNAAVFGRYLAELTAGRPAGLAAPSIYTRYHAEVDWRGYLVVAVSQSGATPEIISTCAVMKQAGAVVVGVTNELNSPMADAVDVVLSTDAGPERAVPATKTATGQQALLATIASGLRAAGPSPAIDLGGLPGAVTAVLADPEPAVSLAHRWADVDRLVVAGRGLGYAAALETALKVKETTGSLAEGISTADLLHGPIATVYAGAPVLLIDAGGPAAADLEELRELLGPRHADVATLPLPAGPEPVQVIAATVRGQQLAHAMARAKGFDPDAPADLSKVTATI